MTDEQAVLIAQVIGLNADSLNRITGPEMQTGTVELHEDPRRQALSPQSPNRAIRARSSGLKVERGRRWRENETLPE